MMHNRMEISLAPSVLPPSASSFGASGHTHSTNSCRPLGMHRFPRPSLLNTFKTLYVMMRRFLHPLLLNTFKTLYYTCKQLRDRKNSLFFAGSFLTSFATNATALNNTNNPNIPYSPGATPFSSSLVPVPLEGAQILGQPSSSNPQFSNIPNILCPAGPDGPGNTWLAANGNGAVITVHDFSSINAYGVHLGNTSQSGFGTMTSSVTSIPDNAVQTLSYVNPSTGQNMTHTNTCPLSTDSSILYQDFIFTAPVTLTGIQITLFGWVKLPDMYIDLQNQVPVMQTLAGTTYIHIQAVVDMWGVGRPREQLLLTGPAHSSSLWEGTGRLASHIWLSRPVPPYSLQEGAGRHNVQAGRHALGISPSGLPTPAVCGRWPAGLGMNSYFLLWSAWRDILLAYICHFEANLSTFEEIFIGVELYVVI
ncbi:hypothetical protein F4604DRAFT_1995599 [Suillus subluteus]|nr:hypothetical protein F4604DRAFT_1995599 [Suillus subluteus]